VEVTRRESGVRLIDASPRSVVAMDPCARLKRVNGNMIRRHRKSIQAKYATSTFTMDVGR
jgi:hypothetical protein